MIQLRLLGPLSLSTTGEGDPAVLLSQPKRLALLAYLALTGSDSLERRDKAMTVFWPEQSQERARHALNQGLHVLRRALPPSALVTLGDGLGVDKTLLWCDAVAFRELLDRGQLAEALELYRGDLLDGFFVSECGDFERWLDETRRSLRAQAAGAAAQLAEQYRISGEVRAVEWARRACDLAPYDQQATRRLMLVLAERGNPAAALDAFDQLTRRLAHELELTPSAELHQFAGEIRARLRVAPSIEALTVQEPSVSASLAVSPARPRRRPVLLASWTAALIAVVVLGTALLRGRSLRAVSPPDAATLGRVAVLPFEVQGSLTRGDSLGRDLVELLGSRLDGAGPLRVVPADSVLRALTERKPLGLAAGSIIEGGVTASEGTLHIHAAWRRALDRSLIADATVEGGGAQLFSLLDRLAIQLLAQAQSGPRHALARTAALSTISLPALKAYLTGEQDFSEGRFTAASQAFERATVLDSTFALAQYRLGVAALWAEDYPLAAAEAGTRALRHSATLSDRDRRLLSGFSAWRRGDRDTAASKYLSILASDHDNLEAWFQLGETLFHYNPSWGLPIAEARDAFRQVLRLDPDHWGAHWHLAMVDAYEGKTSELDRHLDHLLNLGPATDYRLEIAELRACAHRDGAARTRLLESLRSVGEGRLLDMSWRCAVYGRDLDGAEALAHLLIERRTVRFAETQGRYLLAQLAAARGKRAEALAELDSLQRLSVPMALSGKTDVALLPEVMASREVLEQLSQDWWRWRRQTTTSYLDVAMGRLEAELRRPALAEAVAASLDTATDEPGAQGLSRAEAAEIRALLSLRQGNSGPALRQLEALPPAVWFGEMVSAPGASRPWERFQIAETLAAAGRIQEALRWYGSLNELSMYDLVFSPVVHLRRAALYLRLADTTATAEEYARFLELWKNADPELQPIVTRARERLTQLSVHR